MLKLLIINIRIRYKEFRDKRELFGYNLIKELLSFQKRI